MSEELKEIPNGRELPTGIKSLLVKLNINDHSEDIIQITAFLGHIDLLPDEIILSEDVIGDDLPYPPLRGASVKTYINISKLRKEDYIYDFNNGESTYTFKGDITRNSVMIDMVSSDKAESPVLNYYKNSLEVENADIQILQPDYFEDYEPCGYCNREIGTPHKPFCRQ